jgi:hypothetical protein
VKRQSLVARFLKFDRATAAAAVLGRRLTMSFKVRIARYAVLLAGLLLLPLAIACTATIPTAAPTPWGPCLADPTKFKVELYEDLSRFEGVTLAFHLAISDGQAGFPPGLFVTTGPLPGKVEIPADSGRFFPGSDRLLYLDGPFRGDVFASGFNSIEALIFARGAYGQGMLITEPRENRIDILRPECLLQPGPYTVVNSTFASDIGSDPFGATGLAYGFNDKLFVADGAGGNILQVDAEGRAEFFAKIPLATDVSLAVVKGLLFDTSGRFGGGLVASTFTMGEAKDAIFYVSQDGNATQAISDADRLSMMEFITLGPGGAFGSDIFVAALGSGLHGDGGVYTMCPDGNLVPFLTGIDPTCVVFDTDFNQANEGYHDGPGRIWRITPLGGTTQGQ